MNCNIYIIRFGEISLKGKNKPYFERVLLNHIKRKFKDFENINLFRKQGLIFLETSSDISSDMVLARLSKVFGIASVSPAKVTKANMEYILEDSVSYMKELIQKKGTKTFKVFGKRSDKNFPVKSPELSRQVGAAILKANLGLKVDVHNPDCKLYVHVREENAYIYEEVFFSHGGLPAGTNGKGTVLLSGGIDSPVASFMMAKRGMSIEGVHFHSFPYTSPRSAEKVKELASIVSEYAGPIKLHMINLFPIQKAVSEKCRSEYSTIINRRFMMRIAEKISKNIESKFLITGESLGQVASQTAEGIYVVDSSVKLPVLRPLIGFEKTEIIDLAKKIGTFEKSIEPYEDCCTVFLPKHPATKPKKDVVEEQESKLDIDKLIDNAINEKEIFYID